MSVKFLGLLPPVPVNLELMLKRFVRYLGWLWVFLVIFWTTGRFLDCMLVVV